MRIERIQIDGFGRFANAGWDLGPGLTVMLGENEAGKTTLLNALRAMLFGFEMSRGGRVSYPPLAGGRRGGRLTLLTSAGERWVVERHGPRGGAGALAVRAPSGSQGGQETLDRLLRGADRDLFNSIFAFGLGELQDLSSLGSEGVRGRIYGAAAGLGGTSAVDVERRLRQEQEDLFKPTGRLQPINRLFTRMDELHARIGELSRQPQEFEAAHRERAGAQAAANAHRESARAIRGRAARFQRVLAAAPAAATLDQLEAQLAGGDALLDALPPDAVAGLDRRLAALAEARTRLDALDEQLAEIAVQAAGLGADEAVLEAADEIDALDADRRAVAAAADRLREASAAEARHAAAVSEQLARAGAWDEARLLALDDSIPAVEAVRAHERNMGRTRADAEASERRHAAAADELAAREREDAPADARSRDPDDAAAWGALRRLQLARARREGSTARLPAIARHPGSALLLVVAPLVAGLAIGSLAGNVAAGAVIGALVAVSVAAALRALSRPANADDEEPLLAVAGLPPGASDDEIAQRGDALAEARARRALARDQAGSLAARRQEVARLAAALGAANEAHDTAVAAWESWLTQQSLPPNASPEVVRQVLQAAGTARRAAKERDEERRIVASIESHAADADRRMRSLLGRLGLDGGGTLEGRIAGLVHRLDRSRADHRTAQELEARRQTLIERRGPHEAAVRDLEAAVDEHLAAIGCAGADELRGRAVAAAERRGLQQRLREASAGLAGIAGAPQAVESLRAEVRERDLADVEAALATAAADAEQLEAEERRLVGRVGELDARIRSLEAAEELGALRQELAGLEGRVGELATEWSVRAITGRLLAETRSRYERERQPDVIRAASRHFERITDGRYARIVAPPGDSAIRVETDAGESRSTEELSRGTAEQLYLALRFGLIEEFARQAEPLPVVMDDILVNFDSDRAGRAAAAVAGLAERHQVVYFTCHPWTAELLDPAGAATVALS